MENDDSTADCGDDIANSMDSSMIADNTDCNDIDTMWMNLFLNRHLNLHFFRR